MGGSWRASPVAIGYDPTTPRTTSVCVLRGPMSAPRSRPNSLTALVQSRGQPPAMVLVPEFHGCRMDQDLAEGRPS